MGNMVKSEVNDMKTLVLSIWGDTLAIYGNGDLDLGYLGGIYDETTGLIYVGSGQYYDPHTGRFLTRSVKSQQTNPYVPWAADPSGMLFAPLALFSLVYGRRKKQAAKWEILLLVLLMGGSLALGLTACGGGPSATPTVQAPSVPVPSSAPTQQGGTVSNGTPVVNGTPNVEPTTICKIFVTKSPKTGSTSETTESSESVLSTTPIIIFFAGCSGDTSHTGPEPKDQAIVWYEIADVSIQYYGDIGLDNKAEKINDNYKYKSGQISQLGDMSKYANSLLYVIGYSAGADAALMFAYKFLQHTKLNDTNGFIQELAILGPTMTGGLPVIEGSSYSGDLSSCYTDFLDELLLDGTDIYVLDDEAGGGNDTYGYKAPDGATGFFEHVSETSRTHFAGSGYGSGTNNDPALRDTVLDWFNQH